MHLPARTCARGAKGTHICHAPRLGAGLPQAEADLGGAWRRHAVLYIQGVLHGMLLRFRGPSPAVGTDVKHTLTRKEYAPAPACWGPRRRHHHSPSAAARRRSPPHARECPPGTLRQCTQPVKRCGMHQRMMACCAQHPLGAWRHRALAAPRRRCAELQQSQKGVRPDHPASAAAAAR